MAHMFEPGQDVEVHHTTDVFGYIIMRGKKGTVISVNDSLGRDIFRVKFDDREVVLPMREGELVLQGQPLADGFEEAEALAVT